MADTTTALSQWLLTRFERYRKNRVTIELGWRKSWAAYKRDPELYISAWKDNEARKSWQSRAVSPLTKIKAKTAFSAMMDVLVSGGRMAFMLAPDDADLLNAAPAPGVPPGEPSRPEVRDVAISRFEDLLHTQLDACDAPEEFALCVLISAIIGEGYMKRYVQNIQEDAWVLEGGVWNVNVSERRAPAVAYISPFACFRDVEARRLQDGEGFFERSYWPLERLYKYRNAPMTIESELSEAITSASATQAPAPDGNDAPTRENVMETGRPVRMLEYWGLMPRERVEEFIRGLGEGAPPPAVVGSINEEADMVEGMVLMADDRIIRFAMTERRDRPYYRMPFEDDPESLAGTGVGENISQEQHTLTGATRCFEDLCKKLSNYTYAVKERLLDDGVPHDGLAPGDPIRVTEDCDDVRKAIMPIEQPHDALKAITEGLEMFMGLADLASLIPRAEHGQQDPNPQTAYELAQRMDRAGKYLAGAIRNADRMVEDMIRDLYRWNMRNPDIPADWKGKWKVRALGLNGFESRAMRVGHLMTLLEQSKGDERISRRMRIHWVLDEIARARGIAPDQLWRPEAEVAAEEQATQAAQAAQMPAPGSMQGLPAEVMAAVNGGQAV